MGASVRNPIVSFVVAILGTLGLATVAIYASTFIPFLEFRLFFLGFALFGSGVLAARRTFLGSLGFVGTYLGAFLGLYLGEVLFWANPWMEILALTLAAASGLGGFMNGKIGMHRLVREIERAPGVRRCHNCGERVGASAHKCWSCKATLTF